MLMQVEVEQMDIFQLQHEPPALNEKCFSVSYFDFSDRLFHITVSAADQEAAIQKVRAGEIRHPQSRGYLRSWRTKEIKNER